MAQIQEKNPEEYNEELREYASKCRELRRDLNHVLTDLDFIQKKGQIVYAVDHSEIYAYTLPRGTVRGFRLFASDSLSWTGSLQRLALQRLFDGSSEKIILLKPYAIELQRFVRLQYRKALDDAKKQTLEVQKERERLMKDPKAARIIELGKKAESGTTLTYEEEKEVANFLERNEAVMLLALIREHNNNPLSLIRSLFNRQKFADLEDLVNVDTSFDSDETRHWYKKLAVVRELRKITSLLRKQKWFDLEKNLFLSSRELLIKQKFEDLEIVLSDVSKELIKKQSNTQRFKEVIRELTESTQENTLFDAAAIVAVQRANHVLRSQNRNEKLLLVARSPSMHMLFAHQSPQDQQRYATSDLLRHPRSFSVFGLQGMPTENEKKRMQTQLENIDAFLEATEKHSDFMTNENYNNRSKSLLKEQEKLLTKIKADWNATGALMATWQGASSYEDDSWNQSPEEVQYVLRLLRSSDNLQELIVGRLNELANELELQHLQLGGFVQISGRTQQEFLSHYLVAEDLNRKYILKVSKIPLQGQLPYSLEFYTDAAKELLRILRRGSEQSPEKRVERSEVRRFFQRGLEMNTEYEPLLVLAYVLGALKQWKLAEKYCKWALELVSETSEISSCEGVFFLAICMRKEWRSVERHKRAIELLDSHCKVVGESGAEADPRYLKEKATHILWLNTDFIPAAGEEFPHPDEAITLLNEAYEKVKNDEVLKLRIITNRLYYFIETGQIDKYVEQVKADYEELIKLKDEIDTDDSKWPVFTIDTMEWTQWNILDYLDDDTDSEKERIVWQFKRLVDRSRGKERERCQRHLNAVEQGQRRQNWIAVGRAETSAVEGEL